jgi:hypothetical protein
MQGTESTPAELLATSRGTGRLLATAMSIRQRRPCSVEAEMGEREHEGEESGGKRLGFDAGERETPEGVLIRRREPWMLDACARRRLCGCGVDTRREEGDNPRWAGPAPVAAAQRPGKLLCPFSFLFFSIYMKTERVGELFGHPNHIRKMWD